MISEVPEEGQNPQNPYPPLLDDIPLDENGIPRTSVLAFGYERGSAVIRPIDEGKAKGLAVRAMEEQTEMHMNQIYEQMKVLAVQAQAIQKRKEISERIYHATIRFEPLIGRTYYLYTHEAKDVLSLIAPEEWGRSRKYKTFVAKLRLLADHTWELLDVE